MTRTTPARLARLTGEVRSWQGAGLLEPAQADAILAGYTAGRRLNLVRLLLVIGAVFVGVGAIWLVAANLESLSPGLRIALALVAWLAALAGGETLAVRGVLAPLVGAVRLLAALLVGAVVFQAAQTLQVPAWEPVLVGCWAAAALVHAYAVRAVAPLVVGVATGTAYILWSVLDDDWSGLGFVVALGAVGLAAMALAGLHDRWLRGFAPVWREAGALLALVAVIVGAFPPVVREDWEPGVLTWMLAAGVSMLLVAALALGSRLDRAEAGLTLLALLGTVGLVLWEAGADGASDDLSGADVAHAVLGIALCAGAAVALAVDGTLRESSRLTALATGTLVIVTTLQAFTVFAPVLEGAWLFVFLGVVLVGTGLAFDRGRRRLAEAL